MDREMEVARAVAPEDIRPGDYVSVLHVIAEMPSWLWDNDLRNTQMVRFAHLPRGQSAPAEVLDVCLPYLLVKTARGKRRLVDVRKYRLARVSEEFGRRVFEEAEAERQAEKKKSEPKEDEKKEVEKDA